MHAIIRHRIYAILNNMENLRFDKEYYFPRFAEVSLRFFKIIFYPTSLIFKYLIIITNLLIWSISFVSTYFGTAVIGDRCCGHLAHVLLLVKPCNITLTV